MESKKLEALLLSADLGSFTKAAEVLGYTQSGLTHMMNSLEKEIGFPLLERGRNGVMLSPAGQDIAPAIREFLQATARLDHAIESASKSHQPVVRLSVYNSIASHWLPPILQRFQQSNPEVSVDIRMATHIDDCYQLLDNGSIDAILGSRQSGTSYTWYHLFDDKMYAILPKGSYPDTLTEFPVSYFNDQSFIMPTQGFNRDILPIFERANVQPRIQPTTVDDPTVVKMVEHGLGISMMTELVLKGRDENVLTLPVSPACYRELGIAVHSAEHMSDALRAFVVCIQQTVADLLYN